MTIRTILVDDEPLATQGLQLRLQAFDDVEIVATAANGREAIRQIKTHKPDLVFIWRIASRPFAAVATRSRPTSRTWSFSTFRCRASTASR